MPAEKNEVLKNPITEQRARYHLIVWGAIVGIVYYRFTIPCLIGLGVGYFSFNFIPTTLHRPRI
jgi:hypothetical protein